MINKNMKIIKYDNKIYMINEKYETILKKTFKMTRND